MPPVCSILTAACLSTERAYLLLGPDASTFELQLLLPRRWRPPQRASHRPVGKRSKQNPSPGELNRGSRWFPRSARRGAALMQRFKFPSTFNMRTCRRISHQTVDCHEMNRHAGSSSIPLICKSAFARELQIKESSRSVSHRAYGGQSANSPNFGDGNARNKGSNELTS